MAGLEKAFVRSDLNRIQRNLSSLEVFLFLSIRGL